MVILFFICLAKVCDIPIVCARMSVGSGLVVAHIKTVVHCTPRFLFADWCALPIRRVLAVEVLSTRLVDGLRLMDGLIGMFVWVDVERMGGRGGCIRG